MNLGELKSLIADMEKIYNDDKEVVVWNINTNKTDNLMFDSMFDWTGKLVLTSANKKRLPPKKVVK